MDFRILADFEDFQDLTSNSAIFIHRGRNLHTPYPDYFLRYTERVWEAIGGLCPGFGVRRRERVGRIDG